MEINCGETTYVDITLTGTEVSATDVIRFGIKQTPDPGAESVISKTVSGNEVVDGSCTVTLTAAETAQLVPGMLYYCDAGLQSGNNYYYIGKPAQEIEVHETVTGWQVISS